MVTLYATVMLLTFGGISAWAARFRQEKFWTIVQFAGLGCGLLFFALVVLTPLGAMRT